MSRSAAIPAERSSWGGEKFRSENRGRAVDQAGSGRRPAGAVLVLGWRTTSPRSRVAQNGTLPSRGTAARIWSTRRGRPLGARRAKLQEYPAYLQERWWAGNAGELLGKWDTMASGGAGWLLSAGQVEKWVREAVTKGVAARRRTRRANARVRGRLMEILNWITRRPGTDEMLRLDRAMTRTSTRRTPDARHALASAANDRRHRPC
jgi:hypothetical protein